MYKAIICKLTNIRKHPNADRLMLGDALGYTVIIGQDIAEGALGVFFEPDGQLSTEFVKANKLDEPDGYFDEKRRVRAIRLRGTKSEGFWMPISCISWFEGNQKYSEGDMFDEIGGVPICNKYETRATRARRVGGPNQKKKRKILPTFPEHVDTEQLRHYARQLFSGALLTLTWKLHGTSTRFGRVEDVLWNRWGFRIVRDKYVAGSRRVQLGAFSDGGYYGDNSFRYKPLEKVRHRLHVGEVVYGEIVGWSAPGMPFMSQPISDKELQKTWGTRMVYKYGCPDGEHDFYVYRITRTFSDGTSIDLPWAQVKERCLELNFKHVPEVMPSFIYDGNVRNLQELVSGLVEGPDTIDPSHIREGIVVRVDWRNKVPLFLKEKSFTFKLLEGIVKNNDDYIDTEEAS